MDETVRLREQYVNFGVLRGVRADIQDAPSSSEPFPVEAGR